MKVKDVMSRSVFTCRADAPLADAAKIMWNEDCGFVPVVDPTTQKLCGVVTDRDACMASMTQARPVTDIPVRAVMSTKVSTCRPTDDVSVVHAAMRKAQVRRVPVVDGEGRPIAVVSLNDLSLHALEKGLAPEQEEVARTLGEIGRRCLPVKAPALA